MSSVSLSQSELHMEHAVKANIYAPFLISKAISLPNYAYPSKVLLKSLHNVELPHKTRRSKDDDDDDVKIETMWKQFMLIRALFMLQ